MTDYVDAGEAVAFRTLSNVKGQAPATGTWTTSASRTPRSEPENWMTYYGTYDGQRHSALDQINKDTVKRLSPGVGVPGRLDRHALRAPRPTRSRPPRSSWTASCSSPVPTARSGRSTPTTGEELWRYKHASPFDVSLCCGNVNRGVAVGHGKVYLYTLNAHLIALDAQTGELVFDTVNGDVRAGESGSVAPLLVKDMVVVGSAGGEFGAPRPHGRVRRRDRRAPLALLHGAEAGRARLGDLAATTARRGSAAARTAGSPPRTTRSSRCSSRAPATRRPTSTATSARATTSTPTASSRWT